MVDSNGLLRQLGRVFTALLVVPVAILLLATVLVTAGDQSEGVSVVSTTSSVETDFFDDFHDGARRLVPARPR